MEKMFEWRVFSCYFTANLNGKIRQLILVSILFDLFHPFVCLFVCFFFLVFCFPVRSFQLLVYRRSSMYLCPIVELQGA